MVNNRSLLGKYKATVAYMITVVIVNILYSVIPFVMLLGCKVSPADTLVGAIYIMRDFAQREIQHRVIVAMIASALLSYWLAENHVVLASVAAFVVGETIDWIIFTFTRRPLSQRLIRSAMVSVPLDTYVFLYVLGNVNRVEMTALTLAKFLGVLVLWFSWRRKKQSSVQYQAVLT